LSIKKIYGQGKKLLGDKLYELKYEDLIMSPDESLGHIQQWLGLLRKNINPLDYNVEGNRATDNIISTN